VSSAKNPILRKNGSSANVTVSTVSERNLPWEFAVSSINTIDDAASLSFDSAFSDMGLRSSGAIGLIGSVGAVLESVTNADARNAFDVFFAMKLVLFAAAAHAAEFVAAVVAVNAAVTEPVFRNARGAVRALLPAPIALSS